MSLREQRRIRLDAVRRGGHVHVGVWVGTARFDRRPDGAETGETLGGTRAKCGDLVLREEEWGTFRRLLEIGTLATEVDPRLVGGGTDDPPSLAVELVVDYREEP